MRMSIEQELEQALCLTEVSKGHMSGFSSVAGLDATHRKPLTQLLPWLLQSLRPLNSSHFFQLCNKTSMKAFVSYHPTGSRRVPVPSPYKKSSDWFSDSQTSSRNQAKLFIKRNFCGPSFAEISTTASYTHSWPESCENWNYQWILTKLEEIILIRDVFILKYIIKFKEILQVTVSWQVGHLLVFKLCALMASLY